MDAWGTELTDQEKYQQYIKRKEELERESKETYPINNAIGDMLGSFLYLPIAMILFLLPFWRNRFSGIYQGFIFGCILSNWFHSGTFPTYWYIIPILTIIYTIIAYKYNHPMYLKTFIVSFLIPLIFFNQLIELKDWIIWQLTLAIRSIPQYLPKKLI